MSIVLGILSLLALAGAVACWLRLRELESRQLGMLRELETLKLGGQSVGGGGGPPPVK